MKPQKAPFPCAFSRLGDPKGGCPHLHVCVTDSWREPRELGDVLRLTLQTEDADSLADSEEGHRFQVHSPGYQRGFAVDNLAQRRWLLLEPAKCSFVEVEMLVLELVLWAGAKADRSVAAYNSKVVVGFLAVPGRIVGLGPIANAVAADDSRRLK